MEKNSRANFAKFNDTAEASLINGLIAIGNKDSKTKDLDHLNNKLAHAHFDLREKAAYGRLDKTGYLQQTQNLLNTYAPRYKQICEDKNLLSTNLSDAWKTKNQHTADIKTIAGLFEKIADVTAEKSNTATAAAPEL